MATPVESIEIVKFDPAHPLLSPDPDKRPMVIKSVGVFAVLKPSFDFFVAIYQYQGWSLPAGRIEATDQDPVSAAQREFSEETQGSFEPGDITHMGIIRRGTQGAKPAGSLVFRAKISLYHLGIDCNMEGGQIIRIGGDEESNFITFAKVGEELPPPIYRPEINRPVVKAFSEIKD